MHFKGVPGLPSGLRWPLVIASANGMGLAVEEWRVQLSLSSGPGGLGPNDDGQQRGAEAPQRCGMGFWDQLEEDDEIEASDEGLALMKEEDPGVVLARVERAYREERARVRASVDLDELRMMRELYRTQVADGTLHGIAAVRGNDLLEHIDDRITDLKAARLAEWGR